MISLDVFRLGWHLTKYNLLSTPASIASVLFQLRFSQSRSRASPKRNNWRDGKGAGSTVPDQINLCRTLSGIVLEHWYLNYTTGKGWNRNVMSLSNCE